MKEAQPTKTELLEMCKELIDIIEHVPNIYLPTGTVNKTHKFRKVLPKEYLPK